MSAQYGPIEIPGFTLEATLGSGGFADVFLYTQQMPRRQVAVKILREAVGDPQARAQFESEANVMAALSTHPSIVTIHYAAVSDGGRPYFVMEYCSRPNLAERYKRRPFSVPEMLQTVIRLCGAVETAHRAGILHRDIKPANVLTTDYGWPALTDFGISAIVGESTGGGGGLSLPWSAPEAVAGTGYDRRSDVYALAATAYTLLAGASPFDIAGAPGDMSAFIARILSAPVPPIPRADVPDAIQRLLALGLAKDPAERPQSASEFARSLQRIEQDMRLPVTHMDIPDELVFGSLPRLALDDEAESTRFADSDRAGSPVDDETRLSAGRGGSAPEDATVIGGRRAAGPEADEATRLARRPAEAAPGPEDEATRLARRPAGDGGADDDATRLSPRPGPGPDDGTALAARRPAVRGPVGAGDVPASPRRLARVPGPEREAERYGVRSQPSRPAVTRTPRTPVEPSAALPDETTSRRQGARRRRRGLVALVVIGVASAVILVGGAIAVIVVLTM